MPSIEIRPDDKGAIDEIVAKRCDVHVERMSDSGWFMGLTAANGDYHQFWFGAANVKTKVEFRHTETTVVQIHEGEPKRKKPAPANRSGHGAGI